ncbi:hypothetical protein [Candidatus Nanohalovita haloferacivicina]|uniref:hypothetical protein n=1 Tax=Candidatus Nanohalovita haloferacivicina TaxID=2978046 RepID=UPI00325FB1E1|nr:hypothetical protein HBNXNv_0148 [Candidatus Nanohalobia archaeon BNXNv]
MNSQRSLEKSGSQERRKTIQEIFDQALDNSAAELKSRRLAAEVDESLEEKASQKEIFQACLEASRSYIGADPGMREVAADIFLQKVDLDEEERFFEMYVEECSHAGPRSR